jgi:predicted small secreted protein
MENKVEKKMFLGMDVRVVNDKFIVLKDMFNALGRLNKDGQIENKERIKLVEFLKDIDKESAKESFPITLKGKKQSREIQEVDCLKLETVPIVLTQFKPTARKGEEALKTWRNFMRFVDDLLTDLEVYKYIIIDKERQKEHMKILVDEGGSTMVANQQVNIIMAKLIGVYDQGIKVIKKDELKKYQVQIVVDLLEVRDFVLEKFINAFEFTNSHKVAGEMALKLARKKYGIK